MTKALSAWNVGVLLERRGEPEAAAVVFRLIAENEELRKYTLRQAEARPAPAIPRQHRRRSWRPRQVELLRERVRMVKKAYPTWEAVPVTYSQIGDVLKLSGPEVIKPIYAALYRSESEEFAMIRMAE